MINDIKIDNLYTQLTPKKVTKEAVIETTIPKKEGIVVSNNLSSVVNSMVTEENSVGDNTRVQQMKQRIETGNYTVDTDALSEKLIHNIFLGG